MAITPEDKKDVKGAFGKALANKVAKATRDKNYGHKAISMPKHSGGKLHYSVTDKVTGKTTKKSIDRTPPLPDHF